MLIGCLLAQKVNLYIFSLISASGSFIAPSITHQVFHRSYSFILLCLGIPLYERKSKHNLILAFMVFRAFMISEVILTLAFDPTIGFFTMVTFNGTFLFPPTAYIVLSRRLARMNRLIDEMFARLPLTQSYHRKIIRIISRMTVLSLIIISCDYLAQLGMGLLCLLDQPGCNWVISRTNLVNFALNESTQPFISYSLYLFDALSLIALSLLQHVNI